MASLLTIGSWEALCKSMVSLLDQSPAKKPLDTGASSLPAIIVHTPCAGPGPPAALSVLLVPEPKAWPLVKAAAPEPARPQVPSFLPSSPPSPPSGQL